GVGGEARGGGGWGGGGRDRAAIRARRKRVPDERGIRRRDDLDGVGHGDEGQGSNDGRRRKDGGTRKVLVAVHGSPPENGCAFGGAGTAEVDELEDDVNGTGIESHHPWSRPGRKALTSEAR